MSLITLGFGGGCHWCTEAVFGQTFEAKNVRQGWISSTGEHKSYSEAVLIDCEIKDIEKLVHIHLKTHSSANEHQFRVKYRSAIYYTHLNQIELIDKAIKKFGNKVITKVLVFKEFKLNQEQYLNYYQKNKGNQFCETYIEPKLIKISP